MTFHTVAFEGSIGLVNILQAVRLARKGHETSIGVTLSRLREIDHRIGVRFAIGIDSQGVA